MMATNEQALAVVVVVGVQSVFSGSMPPLPQLVAGGSPAHRDLGAADVVALRAGALVTLAALLSRSPLVAVVGAGMVAVEWAIYRRASQLGASA